jgi:hypothetical protein
MAREGTSILDAVEEQVCSISAGRACSTCVKLIKQKYREELDWQACEKEQHSPVQ